MTEDGLSPEARQRLNDLTPTIHAVENWNLAYLDMLKGLADEELPDLADVEIKNEGMEALKRSRKDHAVAVELKAYAEAFLGSDISAELSNLPKRSGLDDFLDRVLPKVDEQTRRNQFMRFLIAEAETHVDEEMELHPKPGVSREERVKQMAESEFGHFSKHGFAATTHFEHELRFVAWRKRNMPNGSLGAANEKKAAEKKAKLEKLLKLLPHSLRSNETMSLAEWRNRAKSRLDIPNRTFDRYRAELVNDGLCIEKPKGRFRVHSKKR